VEQAGGRDDCIGWWPRKSLIARALNDLEEGACAEHADRRLET
jgi:hypothetical protein